MLTCYVGLLSPTKHDNFKAKFSERLHLYNRKPFSTETQIWRVWFQNRPLQINLLETLLTFEVFFTFLDYVSWLLCFEPLPDIVTFLQTSIKNHGRRDYGRQAVGQGVEGDVPRADEVPGKAQGDVRKGGPLLHALPYQGTYCVW